MGSFRRTALLGLLAAAVLGAGADPALGATHAEPVRNPEFPGRIALFPVHNISRQPAPVVEIRKALETAIIERGLSPIPTGEVDAILDRLRVRYVGGVGAALGGSLRDEHDVDGVLITTLDQFDAGDTPRISLHARLAARSGEDIRVLWATSVDWAGDQALGLYEGGRVRDVNVLIGRAIEALADDLARFASSPSPPGTVLAMPDFERRFDPRSVFVSPRAPRFGQAVVRVAVLPFVDDSLRPHAGEILALHVVRELVRMGRFVVIEPGQVRQILLDTRTVQEGGLSFAQADVLHSLLDVDMVVTGDVAEYGEAGASSPPALGFTIYGIDARQRQVVFVARSRTAGRDGVYFFDVGEKRTAHGLAREAVRAVLARVIQEARRKAAKAPGPNDG